MNQMCNDPVFGEMKYKYFWYKKDKIQMFGEKWDIEIDASAYNGEPITEQQRESYKWFEDNQEDLMNQVASAIIDYINKYCEELADTWPGARKVSSTSELIGIVEPTTILFEQDGSTLVLLECKWDPEDGLAVQIRPNIEVGSQTAFL